MKCWPTNIVLQMYKYVFVIMILIVFSVIIYLFTIFRIPITQNEKVRYEGYLTK